jgi:two-component system LytT family sensor kinase
MNQVYPSKRFDDRLARFIGIPVLAFMIPVVFFHANLDNGFMAFLPKWIMAIVHIGIYWEGVRFIYFQTRKRFPYVSQTSRRIFWLLFLSISFIVSASLLLHTTEDAFRILPESSAGVFTFRKHAVSVTILVLCLPYYESSYYFGQLQEVLLEAEQLKKEQVQSQLEMLKSQVNPHFLFNSLNTLASLIPEEPDLAVDFVRKLSKVYRYILEIRDFHTVPLQKELSALKAYHFLLQIRFGESLNVKIDIPDRYLNEHILPLSLQMLIENAVKHNILSVHKPLWIEVFISNGRVIVRNNLQRKNQQTDSTGLGLQNIQNRYQLLGSQPVDVIVTTQSFSVSLPLLGQSAYVKPPVIPKDIPQP